jgi:hypothetical protein
MTLTPAAAAMKSSSDFQPNDWQELVRLYWVLDRLHFDRADVLPFGSAHWLPVKKPQPPADHLLFSRIAALARVPIDGCGRLQRSISLELEREWRQHELIKFDEAAFNSAYDKVEKLNVQSLELQAGLNNLDSNSLALGSLTQAAVLIYEDKNYDRKAPDPPPGGYDFVQIKEAVATINERASVALKQLRPEKTARAKGRPNRGGFGEPIGPGSFKQFVLRFLWDIRTVGGWLTLDKNRNTGTLPKALSRLRPYLPPGFIPKHLPLSTLARIHARAETLAAAIPLDKKLAAEDGDKPNSDPEKSHESKSILGTCLAPERGAKCRTELIEHR